MPLIGRSSRLYQDRRQRQFPSTKYGPGQQMKLSDNPVHHLQLDPTLTNLETLKDNNGVPVTDTGRIQAWPYGDKYAP